MKAFQKMHHPIISGLRSLCGGRIMLPQEAASAGSTDAERQASRWV